MTYRTIKLSSGVWKYFVGRSAIRIKSPHGHRIVRHFTGVLGWSWDEIDRGRRKRYLAIRPSHIRRLIETDTEIAYMMRESAAFYARLKEQYGGKGRSLRRPSLAWTKAYKR